MKTLQVVLQIEPKLKAVAEKAAAADHRSLSGLIEMLLANYCQKQAAAEDTSSPSPVNAAPRAAEMAASAIDHIRDKTVPAEEQQRRKRTLIRGPKEFRDIRRK